MCEWSPWPRMVTLQDPDRSAFVDRTAWTRIAMLDPVVLHDIVEDWLKYRQLEGSNIGDLYDAAVAQLAILERQTR